MNLSLRSGFFPDCLKSAVIKPLLKKKGLELVISNFRPVSNLTFISKLIEKCVAKYFNSHMEDETLLPTYQSAYRASYSTETLLLRLHNDILYNMENQCITSVVAIDLSAAFDTVENSILMQVLKNRFGVTGNAEKWFCSYLENRKFVVEINDSQSKEVTINYSVPQGSILGPTLFSCYSSTLKDVMHNRSESIWGYADDSTFVDKFKVGQINDEETCVKNMENLLVEIKTWMTENWLKMNDSKTEFLYFGHPKQIDKTVYNEINVMDCTVKRSDASSYLDLLWIVT